MASWNRETEGRSGEIPRERSQSVAAVVVVAVAAVVVVDVQQRQQLRHSSHASKQRD